MRNYCSLECRAVGYAGAGNPKWRGGEVERKCLKCGKEFSVFRVFAERGVGLYCSRQCSPHRTSISSPVEKRLNASMSKRVRDCLTSDGKGRRKWVKLVGFTYDELKKHLESRFQEGMTWENYGRGGWHIDHIIPISHFRIYSAECQEFRECWALSNLRPLWEHDNLSRGGAYKYEHRNTIVYVPIPGNFGA